jgi:HEAT repeat protein
MFLRRLFCVLAAAGVAAGCAHPGKARVLARQLLNKSAKVRIRAARQLAALGPAGAPAQPELLAILRDGRREVSEAGEAALAAQGDAAVDPLVAALQDKDSWFRCRAAETLGGLGAAGARAIPALVTALNDHDLCVHGQAMESLGKIGEPAVPALLDALKHENAVIRGAAAQSLERMSPEVQKRAGAVLLPAFRSRDPFERGEAALRLGGMGRLAIEPLLSCVADPDADLRFKSVVALGDIGRSEPAVVSALLGRFRDDERTVRLKAAVVLARFAERDGSVIETLLPLLTSTNADDRRGALWTVGQMGAAGEPAVPVLVGILESGDESWRDDVLECLMGVGTSSAQKAVERFSRPAR